MADSLNLVGYMTGLIDSGPPKLNYDYWLFIILFYNLIISALFFVFFSSLLFFKVSYTNNNNNYNNNHNIFLAKAGIKGPPYFLDLIICLIKG